MCGVLQRCYSLLDEMLAICVARAVELTDETGLEACRACAAGKPLNRMTLGQRVQVLISLDCALATFRDYGPVAVSRIRENCVLERCCTTHDCYAAPGSRRCTCIPSDGGVADENRAPAEDCACDIPTDRAVVDD